MFEQIILPLSICAQRALIYEQQIRLSLKFNGKSINISCKDPKKEGFKCVACPLYNQKENPNDYKSMMEVDAFFIRAKIEITHHKEGKIFL